MLHRPFAHSHPRISAPTRGFSSLAYSVRAAACTWRIAIAAFSSAAPETPPAARCWRITPPRSHSVGPAAHNPDWPQAHPAGNTRPPYPLPARRVRKWKLHHEPQPALERRVQRVLHVGGQDFAIPLIRLHPLQQIADLRDSRNGRGCLSPAGCACQTAHRPHRIAESPRSVPLRQKCAAGVFQSRRCTCSPPWPDRSGTNHDLNSLASTPAAIVLPVPLAPANITSTIPGPAHSSAPQIPIRAAPQMTAAHAPQSAAALPPARSATPGRPMWRTIPRVRRDHRATFAPRPVTDATRLPPRPRAPVPVPLLP